MGRSLLRLVVALGGLWLIRRLRRRSAPAPTEADQDGDEVDVASRDSFPASDAPGWAYARV